MKKNNEYLTIPEGYQELEPGLYNSILKNIEEDKKNGWITIEFELEKKNNENIVALPETE